jgi:hypothetical protein
MAPRPSSRLSLPVPRTAGGIAIVVVNHAAGDYPAVVLLL